MKTISPDERAVTLVEACQDKMARSVHAFVRGSTASFYRWLAELPAGRRLPVGPPVWICGDCHLGNLGPVADADHRIDIQIRDLDQTVIGNPAFDLVRLGLSLETAARSSDLPGLATAHLIEAMATSYTLALADPEPAQLPEPDFVRTVRKRALHRGWRQLAEERIGDTDPSIPIGRRFWPLTKDERKAIDALFGEPLVRARSLELAGLSDSGRIRVVDAAYWKKGCSSLGYLRYAVLLGVREKKGDEHLALVDIKEAVTPLPPRAKGAKMPRDDAERVVAGALALAPNLGARMVPAHLLGKPVVLRELMPEDMKLEVRQFSRKEAVLAAGYLANVVGRAHARQMDKGERKAWLATLDRRDSAPGAPTWLWRAIVDLAGLHESAYLEHCRAHALEAA